MKERERMVVLGLVGFLLLLWLGFLVHRSPRFAGSSWGGVLGVAGALLMVWPVGYSAVKRIAVVKTWVTRRVRMRTLLAWHVYTGILGAALAILHTGHRFTSPLGRVLTGAMLVAVLTGFVGRYLLGQISEELREKQDMLARSQEAYRQTVEELARGREAAPVAASRGALRRMAMKLFAPEEEVAESSRALSRRAVRLAESMADLEYAIKTHELLKRRFAQWLDLHIAASIVFYVLLALHVWAGIYFGLRWFE
jgi:hypothetical protein